MLGTFSASPSAPIIPGMQVRTKLTLCVGSLVTVVAICASLLVWNTYSSTYNHKRTDLAYRELAGYLQLSSEVFRTFKQARRDLMSGEGEVTFNLGDAEESVFEIVRAIESDAMAEVEVGLRHGEGDNDVSRVETLAGELSAAFSDLRIAQKMIRDGDAIAGRDFLANSLKTRIDGRIDEFVQGAVADEKAEVASALAEIQQFNRIEFWVAIVAAVLALLLAGAVVYILAHRVGSSLSNLETGADIFSSGHLDHRIPVSGVDEFAVLSSRFNTMAQQLQDQRNALEEARTSLEHRVAERTEELRIANDGLKRRDDTRTQFFADIGHELRTPITAVRGEAEVALRSRRDQRAIYRSALERIVGIADQLTRFVNDIFLIARQQAGVIDMRRHRLNLIEPITTAVEQMQALASENDAIISTTLPDGIATIDGDEQRICQLIQVMISNAIHHTPAGVRIEIDLQSTDRGWQLSVRDDGPGIPADHVSQIFERYYRGGADAKLGNLQGAGLGLPIAKSIVEAHGGRIWIDENMQRGTKVVASFPGVYTQTDEAPKINSERIPV